MQLEPMKCKTKFGEKNMAFTGITYGETLPLHIKTLPAIDQFKANIKKYDSFKRKWIY